jgi:S-formylglutathione hydrolase FrmB
MAFFSGTIFSDALHIDTMLGAILPHDTRLHRSGQGLAPGIQPGSKPKTLILLHGLSDNYTVWEHRTSILRYAEKYDIAVLLPDAQRSFYQDLAWGQGFFTYISEELPRLAAEMFNISVAPEDLYIAGLSMGGYGAALMALRCPEKYAGVGCFSGAYDMRANVAANRQSREGIETGLDRDFRAIFGADYQVPPSADLFALIPEAAKKRPPFYMACGTEDFLYPSNIAFRDALRASGAFRVTYEEWSGSHEWAFWDLAVQKFLAHFFGNERGSKGI